MKIRKGALIDALDKMIEDHTKATRQFEACERLWRTERLNDWKRQDWPKWKQLRDLISEKARSKGPITYEDVVAIFPNKRGYSQPELPSFHPDAPTGGVVTLKNGKTVQRPAPIGQVKALRALLDNVEDEAVSDTQLVRLGFKDIAPIYRAAVELGGLLA